jgi:hypothetical protein
VSGQDAISCLAGIDEPSIVLSPCEITKERKDRYMAEVQSLLYVANDLRYITPELFDLNYEAGQEN